MRSTLIELGPWPDWAAALAIVLGAALVLYVDLRGRQADGEDEPAPTGRLVVLGLIGAALGMGLWLAVNRWGPVKVRSWGTMLMVGFGLGLAWAAHASRDEEDITLETLIDLTIVILIGAIVGARVVSALLNWQDFAQHPGQLLRVWEGGLSFHGGLIGGWGAGSILIVRRGLGYGRIVDLVIPSVALGYAITRVGCFLNGCCYGIPTDGPLGVCFHELAGNEGLVPRHATQLYAAALNIGIFFILIKVKPRLRRPGHLALVYLVLYSVYRFAVEYLRRGATAHSYDLIPSLTQAQAASVLMFAIGAGWLLVDWLMARQQGAREGIDDGE